MRTPKSQIPVDRVDKKGVVAQPIAASKMRPLKEHSTSPVPKPAKKNKNINLRISEADLDEIKRIAIREGMPYQTLIGSLVHKYAVNQMKDV